MKRIFLFFLCLSIAGLAPCFAQQKEPDLEKLFKIDSSHIWDFGKVPQNTVVKHEFELKNDLDKELKILDVNSSCGCTVAEVKKKSLKPGESTKIEVKFNSKGYSKKITQFVFVATDNTNRPVEQFIIKADVQKKD